MRPAIAGWSTKPTSRSPAAGPTFTALSTQHGQVIDVLVSQRRDGAAARAFFKRALKSAPPPGEVTTDRAPVYPRVIDDVVPGAGHDTEQYANNRVEADHGRLKARLRPMRGLKTIRSLRTIEVPARDRVRVAFSELAHCL